MVKLKNIPLRYTDEEHDELRKIKDQIGLPWPESVQKLFREWRDKNIVAKPTVILPPHLLPQKIFPQSKPMEIDYE